MYSAICHDLGKPPTTKFEDGRIRSRGHEEAGVEPSRNLLNRFYNDMNGKKGLAEITKQVLPLVAEHLKPKQYWLNATKKVDDSPESEDTDEKLVDPPKALKRLAKRLAEGKARKNSYPDGGGTNLYMLALLAEADQEGRNPKENKSLEREEVEELEEWQSWFLEIAKELKIADKPLPNYFKGEEVMEILGVAPGKIIGIMIRMVNEQNIDQPFKSKDEAAQYAQKAYQALMARMQNMGATLEDIRNLEDPRTVIDL